jgi:DNA-binding MurR/RpiR family transcriptional regulator
MAKKKKVPSKSSIYELLLKRFEKLTPTERKPARLLLDNFPMVGLETVAQFAKLSGVSGPTIIRLVYKLGFESYIKFQNKLRQELQARLETPIQKTDKKPTKRGTIENVVGDFGDAVCQNIKQSLNNIPTSEINAVVQALSNVKQSVFLLGGRYTDILARHFYLHLHAIRNNIGHVDGHSSTWAEYILDIKKNDILIVFDIRRYQNDVTVFAEKAAKRGARIILFTDQWFSPISHLAHHVFSMQIKVPSNWDSSVAILTLIDVILAKLTRDLWLEVKDRLEFREAIFQSFH